MEVGDRSFVKYKFVNLALGITKEDYMNFICPKPTEKRSRFRSIILKISWIFL